MKSRWPLTRAVLAAVGSLLLGGSVSMAIELTSNYDIEQVAANSELANYGEEAQPAVNMAGGACQQCGTACGNGCCPNGCNPCGLGLPWCSDPCPLIGLQVFSGFESWRGVSEAGNPGNFGALTGLNMGVPVIESLGIAAQFGTSVQIADWMGRNTNGADEATQTQRQVMFTYGFFRRACGNRWQGGIVQDWQINDNFGTLSQEPTLSQWRAQLSYIVDDYNEIGVWAAWRDRGATRNFFGPALPVTYRAVGQTNIFWHAKLYEGGADSWMWIGFPAYGRLNQRLGGSLGEFTLGGMIQAPITERTSAYANFQYMKPSDKPGVLGSTEDSYALGFGISWIPGGSRTRDVTGQRWMPMLPIANNGNFLVDRSL